MSQGARKKVGAQLREKRESKKIGLRQLAKHLGISAAYLSDIEIGNRALPIKRIPAFANALSLDWRQILRCVLQDMCEESCEETGLFFDVYLRERR